MIEPSLFLLAWLPAWFFLIRPLTDFSSSNHGETVRLTSFFITSVAVLGLDVYSGAVAKFSATIIDKCYADTLCVLMTIFLLLELSREDILLCSDRHESLSVKIDYLARLTLLLDPCFSSASGNTQLWSRKHFRQLELYMREREHRVIAPVSTTLSDLRKEFGALAMIYIRGNYGKMCGVETRCPPRKIHPRKDSAC